MPFLVAVGNHDVWSEASESAYAKRFGSLYGSATMGKVHWILLNSYELGKYNRITDAQLAWLKEDLERHRDARHLFVGVHAPLWAYGTASNWMTDVHPLLARYNVRAVFAGHWHTYQRSAIIDGIRYYVTGGAGGLQAESSDATGDFHHYMVVTVKGEDVSYAVVRPGCISADSVVTKESSALAIRIRDEVLGDPRLEFRDSTLVSRMITVPVRNVFEKPLRVAAEWRFTRPVFLLDAYEGTSTVPPGGCAALEFRLTSEWPVGLQNCSAILRHSA